MQRSNTQNVIESEKERELVKQVRELQKANEILKDTLVFFRKRLEEVKPELLHEEHEYVTL